jgi:serine/threonine protein kinase
MNFSDYLPQQYRFVQLIGRGNFTDVYKAWSAHLEKHVVVIVPHSPSTKDNKEAFLSKVQTMTRLHHPSILQVISLNTYHNRPFLVLSFTEQGLLTKHLPPGQVLPLDIIKHYMWQLADALTYLHYQGLVHQYVRPDNLVLNDNEEILLADLDMMVLAEDRSQQEIWQPVNAAIYMAPERFFGKSTPASDQYSLAILVYEWLTGTTLFHGSTAEIVLQHFSTSHPSLPLNTPEITPALRYVLSRALARNPEERFASIQEFVVALDHNTPVLGRKR